MILSQREAVDGHVARAREEAAVLPRALGAGWGGEGVADFVGLGVLDWRDVEESWPLMPFAMSLFVGGPSSGCARLVLTASKPLKMSLAIVGV